MPDSTALPHIRAVEIAAAGADHLMILMEAYFDESMVYQTNVQCCAGYLFPTGKAVEMTERWVYELAGFGIPFFHMVDCAHGNGHFANMSLELRSKIAKTFIDLTKRYAAVGVANIANVDFFAGPKMKSANVDFYPYAALTIIGEVLGEATKLPYAYLGVSTEEDNLVGTLAGMGFTQDNLQSSVNYIFEAAHRTSGIAASAVQALPTAKFPKVGNAPMSLISGISFHEKARSPLLQAADILAWQCVSFIRGILEGRPMRADFRSLLETRHKFYYYYVPNFETLSDKEKRLTFSQDLYPHDDNEIKRREIKALLLANETPASADQYNINPR